MLGARPPREKEVSSRRKRKSRLSSPLFPCLADSYLVKSLLRFWWAARRPDSLRASMPYAHPPAPFAPAHSLPQSRVQTRKNHPTNKTGGLAAVSRRSTHAAHAWCIHAPRFRRHPGGGRDPEGLGLDLRRPGLQKDEPLTGNRNATRIRELDRQPKDGDRGGAVPRSTRLLRVREDWEATSCA